MLFGDVNQLLESSYSPFETRYKKLQNGDMYIAVLVANGNYKMIPLQGEIISILELRNKS